MGWKIAFKDEAREKRIADEAVAREQEIRRPARKEDWWWQPGEWGQWLALEKKLFKEIDDARQRQAHVIVGKITAHLKDADIKVSSTGEAPSDLAFKGVAHNMSHDFHAYLYALRSRNWEEEGLPLFAAQKLFAKQIMDRELVFEEDYEKVIIPIANYLRTTEIASFYRPMTNRGTDDLWDELGEEIDADEQFEAAWRAKSRYELAQRYMPDEETGTEKRKRPDIVLEPVMTYIVFALRTDGAKIREEREQTLSERFGASSPDIAAAVQVVAEGGSPAVFIRKLLTADHKKVADYRALLEAIETAWTGKSSNASVQKTLLKNYYARHRPMNLEAFHAFIDQNCTKDAERVKAVFDSTDKIKLWLQIYEDYEWSNESDNLAGQEAILASVLEEKEDVIRGIFTSSVEEFKAAGVEYDKARERLWRMHALGRFALTTDLYAEEAK